MMVLFLPFVHTDAWRQATMPSSQIMPVFPCVYADWCSRTILDLHKFSNASCLSDLLDDRGNPKPLRLLLEHFATCQVEAARAFASTINLTGPVVRCMDSDALHLPGFHMGCLSLSLMFKMTTLGHFKGMCNP